MENRNCENCAHARPFGGENDNRCEVWDCEYINRKEAIEAFKARRDIDLVRCGECIYRHEHEWYNTCDKHIGHGFEAEYFCKDGERREDE